MHVQSVQKHCFSLSNMQICGIFVAVVVGVVLSSLFLFDCRAPFLKSTKLQVSKWKDLTILGLYGSNCHHKKITKVIFRELTVGQLCYLVKWVSYLTLSNSFDIIPNLLDLLEFLNDAAHDTVPFELHSGTKTPLTAWKLKLISSAELYIEHQATCCFTIWMLLAVYCGTDCSVKVFISAPLYS